MESLKEDDGGNGAIVGENSGTAENAKLKPSSSDDLSNRAAVQQTENDDAWTDASTDDRASLRGTFSGVSVSAGQTTSDGQTSTLTSASDGQVASEERPSNQQQRALSDKKQAAFKDQAPVSKDELSKPALNQDKPKSGFSKDEKVAAADPPAADDKLLAAGKKQGDSDAPAAEKKKSGGKISLYEQDKKDRKRKLNRITAQRKRIRQRAEFQHLKEFQARLSMMNKSLTTENDALRSTISMLKQQRDQGPEGALARNPKLCQAQTALMQTLAGGRQGILASAILPGQQGVSTMPFAPSMFPPAASATNIAGIAGNPSFMAMLIASNPQKQALLQNQGERQHEFQHWPSRAAIPPQVSRPQTIPPQGQQSMSQSIPSTSSPPPPATAPPTMSGGLSAALLSRMMQASRSLQTPQQGQTISSYQEQSSLALLADLLGRQAPSVPDQLQQPTLYSGILAGVGLPQEQQQQRQQPTRIEAPAASTTDVSPDLAAALRILQSQSSSSFFQHGMAPETVPLSIWPQSSMPAALQQMLPLALQGANLSTSANPFVALGVAPSTAANVSMFGNSSVSAANPSYAIMMALMRARAQNNRNAPAASLPNPPPEMLAAVLQGIAHAKSSSAAPTASSPPSDLERRQSPP